MTRRVSRGGAGLADLTLEAKTTLGIAVTQYFQEIHPRLGFEGKLAETLWSKMGTRGHGVVDERAYLGIHIYSIIGRQRDSDVSNTYREWTTAIATDMWLAIGSQRQ